MSKVRTIHVRKSQYFIAPGDTGGNTTVFTEISPGLIQSDSLGFIPTDAYGHGNGWILTASRPTYEAPPNTQSLGDLGTLDPSTDRVFFNSSENLKFSLINNFFRVKLTNNVIEYPTENNLRNTDWWRSSWAYEDPYGDYVTDNYDTLLGNLFNYIDINFPEEMDELSLVLWMNQIDGTIHIPFLFEGAAHPGYDREFKTYTI